MFSKAALVWLAAVGTVTSQEETEPSLLTCSPETFKSTSLGLGPGVNIQSIEAEERHNFTSHGGTHGMPTVEGLDFCQVKARLNHEGTDDNVLIEVWLPLSREAWNGRFQGTGGGGLATGLLEKALGPAIANGYAASSTDGGHSTADLDDAAWVLRPDNTIDWNLLTNFATRSIVESVILGKHFTELFYNQKPKFSYWQGCSMGGRQGYMLAQQYPHLLDGILANAPAISLTSLVMAEFWPQLVMKEEGLWMSDCEFSYFRQKAMESCDMIDGVSDGVIIEPERCDFDPLHVIGQVFYCDDKPVEVSRAMANIVQRINEGPRTPLKASLWHGLSHGTGFHGVAGTTVTEGGFRTTRPFPISPNYIRNFLVKGRDLNVTRLSYGEYMALWTQSNNEFGWLLDADKPDLTNLQASGTKMLTWHGTNDPLIPYQSTVQYRKRVEMLMDGAHEVDKFYRLFLAHGVEHCSGGHGPFPADPLAALVRWVEEGDAPETIEAETMTYEGDRVTRELCAWPGSPQYMGIGDAKRASSWSCHGGTERPVEDETPQIVPGEDEQGGRAAEILGGLKDRLEGLGMGLTIG